MTTTRWAPIKEKHYVIEDCRNAASFIKGKTTYKPKLAIVIGHGMEAFETCIEESDKITFEEINAAFPLFPTCSMPPGKKGCFIFGTVDSVTVLVMHGRFHLYEGHSAQATTFPIRIMNELGIETIIFVNGARGLSPTLEIGDVMVATDHFNTERGDSHPLTGVNIDAQGPRFLRCDTLYDHTLRKQAKRVAHRAGIHLKEGVLIFISGPSFETPFEERMLRYACECRGTLGLVLKYMRRWGSGVGLQGVCEVMDKIMNKWGFYDTGVCMNTVPEVLVADHCGIRVLVLSGVYYVCTDSSIRGRSSQARRDSILIEEEKQSHVPPKIITLLRGIIQAQDDSKDIDMDFDTYDIARWRFPTKLCVSWTSVIVGTAVGALALMIGPPLIIELFGTVKRRISVTR